MLFVFPPRRRLTVMIVRFSATLTLYGTTFRAHLEKLFGIVWSPICSVTFHFRYQRGAAQLRSVAEIAPTSPEQKKPCYSVWFSFLSTQNPSGLVWTQPWKDSNCKFLLLPYIPALKYYKRELTEKQTPNTAVIIFIPLLIFLPGNSLFLWGGGGWERRKKAHFRIGGS